MVRDGMLTFFHKEQFLLGKWRGFTLGKYKLLERIGIGGVGQVFLCEHRFMRKRVALKVMPPTRAEDPVSLGRFYREARVAAELDHPNIVRTFDIDQDGPLHFLVMEFIDGKTLLEIVKQFGPLNIHQACHYIKQACQALQYAHQRGMIHRDIKPGNIILDRQGTARLLDMGLARFYRDEQDQLTLKYDDKNVLGTADYVAPEQTRDSRNIDIRADIYGMGATFYFLLAGQPPFPEPTVAEKLVAHQTKNPRPIRELQPTVPSGVAKIVEKMMAKAPGDRYQTPAEIAAALEAWTEVPLEAPPLEWMPNLSPAANEIQYGLRPIAAPGVPARDTSRVRLSEPFRPRSNAILALPEMSEAAFEAAATVPVRPPSRPFSSAAVPSSAAIMDEEQLAATPFKRAEKLGSAETKALSTGEPTPRPGSMRPPEPPALETPKSAPELAPRLPSKAPEAGQRPAAAGFKRKSLAELQFPALVELPKPVATAAPPPVARLASPQPAVPLRPSAVSGPKPPELRDRVSEEPFQPTWAGGMKPPSREVLLPAAPGSARNLGQQSPARPPIYRPPTQLPFFDRPVMSDRPSIAAHILRWFLMLAISIMLGSALAGGIWYASVVGWLRFLKV